MVYGIWQAQIWVYKKDIDMEYPVLWKTNSHVIWICSIPEKHLAPDKKQPNVVLSESFLNIGTTNKFI